MWHRWRMLPTWDHESSGTRAGVLVRDDDWHLCANQVKPGVSTSVCGWSRAHACQAILVCILIATKCDFKVSVIQVRLEQDKLYLSCIFSLHCLTVWFVLSGDVLPFLIHSSLASYSCYSEHIAPLGALPPPPPSVPALPLCSIHLPPLLPFVAMVTNVGDNPALWLKRFGRLLSPFDGGCQCED